MKASALALALSALTGATQAIACESTTRPPTIQEAFDQADVVLEGAFAAGGQTPGKFAAETKLDALKVWKGSAKDTLTFKSEHNTCAPYPFGAVGHRYIVYLRTPHKPDDPTVVIRAVDATYPVSKDDKAFLAKKPPVAR